MSAAPDVERVWIALPSDRLFMAPLADSRSEIPRIVVIPTRRDGLTIDTAIASDCPILQWNGHGWSAQIAVSAGLYTTFHATNTFTFDLATVDGQITLPLDIAAGDWSTRVAWVHQSAHYGDGIATGDDRPNNLDSSYSREYARATLAKQIGRFRPYFGVGAIVHSTEAAAPLAVQFGAEVTPTGWLGPYAAFDVQARAENTWNPAFSAEIGVAIQGERNAVRLAFAGRVGPEDTGKLAGIEERWLGLQLAFDAPSPARIR